MRKIPGFHSNLQETGIHIVMHIAPGMVDLHHISPHTGYDRTDAGKFARTVQELNIQFRITAGSYQTAMDNARQNRYVNVAAGKQCHHLFAFDRQFFEVDRR